MAATAPARPSWKGHAAAALGGAGLLGVAFFGAGLAPAEAAAPLTALAAFSSLAVAATALLVGASAQRRVRRVSAEVAKTAQDLDSVAARLIAAEHRIAQAAGAGPAGLDENARREIDAAFGEINAEIGLVSELLRDLATTVAAQERDLDAVKAGAPARSAEARADPPRPQDTGRPAGTRSARSAAAWPAAPTEADRIAADPPPRPAPAQVPDEAVDPAQPRPDRRGPAMMQALASGGLEVHLQPIVSLPQRRVRGYEVLARLKLSDGSLLVPAEFLPALDAAGLTVDLDRQVLARAANIARHLNLRGSEATLGLNLSLASLLTPDLFKGAMRLADEDPELPRRIVFELSQATWRRLDVAAAAGLTALRTKGFGFGLDRASDARLDPIMLADRGVRYVKLPASLLIDPQQAARLDIAAEDLATHLQRAGIALIAEKIERENQVPDLIEANVPLAQGFLFAAPRAIGQEALGAAKPATVQVGEEAPPEATERRPFRAFLRRAG